MDPITTAIAGAVGKTAVVDAYNGLKNIIKKKFGKSDLSDAIEKLEAKPDSKSRLEVLQEEVETAKANQDSEILQLAQELIKLLQNTSKGDQIIAKFHVTESQVGVVGDKVKVEGGIHFGETKK